jgi:outer membrane protein OmpA-like peptidoglycan-associated protein
MVMKKNPNPVERVLTWLDEGAEIENYATHEIEGLPIEEVCRRLENLGVDSSLPGYIKGLTINGASPVQKVLDLLDNQVDTLSYQEIEHLAPEDVTAKLNSLGLNYRAGVNEIIEVTDVRFNDEQTQKTPVKSHSAGIRARLKMRVFVALAKVRDWIGVAKIAGFAAAATAVLALIFAISHLSQLEDKSALLEHKQTSSQQEVAGPKGQPRQPLSSGATAGAPRSTFASLPPPGPPGGTNGDSATTTSSTTSTSSPLRPAPRIGPSVGLPTLGLFARGTESPNMGARRASGAMVEQASTEPRPAIAFNSIQFALGSDEITSDASQTLRNLGNVLNHQLADQKAFLIEGHIDLKEAQAYNDELAWHRAEAAKDFLVREAGVSPQRLRTIGKGFSDPADPTNPYAAENRRVVVVNVGG